MPSMLSSAARSAAAGASTRTSTPRACSATASRSRNEPARSPAKRGYECATNRTRTGRSATAGGSARAVGRTDGPRGARLVQLPPQLRELGALAGDQLAEQAADEQHDADDHAGGD